MVEGDAGDFTTGLDPIGLDVGVGVKIGVGVAVGAGVGEGVGGGGGASYTTVIVAESGPYCPNPSRSRAIRSLLPSTKESKSEYRPPTLQIALPAKPVLR